jgi:hypothetical protein
MNPRTNPYAPGAGSPPPELAGRDELIERAAIALDRIRGGKAARSLILVGLRGVGKTVLLNRLQRDAEGRGIHTLWIEAPEGRSLPAIIAPALRAALLRLDRRASATQAARRALAALAGFVNAVKVRYGDLELSMDIPPVSGLADSGDLEADLAELFAAAGEAAREQDTALILIIDELQLMAEPDLAILSAALHSCAQRQLPITLLAAGLPQLLSQTGQAKSYVERLFDYAEIGRLDTEAAARALTAPAAKAGVKFSLDGLQEILRQTDGYPYFLQEWGKHAWNVAAASPIRADDVHVATRNALAYLDASFFRVRFERLTPREKKYLRGMAELGAGPHRSSAVADQLGGKVTSLSPIRNTLVAKGMIYSPRHGEVAFTVPLFDGFMKRMIPAL